MNEFCIEWLKGGKYAGVTAPAGSGLKAKVQKLAEKHPEDVKIMAENQDGSIFAHVPISYVKLRGPVAMSEEAKEKNRERLRQYRERQKAEDGVLEDAEEYEEDLE